MAATGKNLLNSGILFTDRRKFYLGEQMVKELWPEVTPFVTMVSNMGTRQTPDPDFKMFEHRSGFINQEITVGTVSPDFGSSGVPGDTATCVVTTASGLHTAVDSSYIGLKVMCFSSDYATRYGVMLITAAVAGAFTSGTITLKALGNPDDATNNYCDLTATNKLIVIGNARGEGTTAPEPFADDLAVVWNSCQIFKTPVQVTGTLYAAALRGYSNELARLRVEKMKEHKVQMERNFLFGVRSNGIGQGAETFGANHQTDADGNMVRTTYGIISALIRYGTSTTTSDSQNIFTINPGTYKYSNFVDDSKKIFQYVPDSGEKIGICGMDMYAYWSKIDNNIISKSGGQIQLRPQEQGAFGYRISRLVTPGGNIQLVYNPIMRGPWSKYMVIVDPSNVEHVQYRPATYQTNIKTDNAFDGIKDVYQNDEGLGITLLETHSLWKLA